MSDQVPKESPRAAAAFLEYCALGPARSLRKLAESNQKYSKSIALLMRWSTQHDWQNRVKQYDAEQARARLARKAERREKMEDRHEEEAKEEQEIARELLKTDAKKGRISLAAVQLLKNSREDERRALETEGMEWLEEANKGGVTGVAVYLPEKHNLKMLIAIDSQTKGGDA